MSCLPRPPSPGPARARDVATGTPPPGARPGDLIDLRPIPGPTGSEGFALRYWSTGVRGNLVAVTGVLYRPAWHPPGDVPLIAWAHGTYGLGAHCTNESYFSLPGCTGMITLAVSRGAVLVAPDYEGLGTAAPHPYLVGRAAARNVLDAVRAAWTVGPVGPSSPVILLGWSQGGNAVLHAAEWRAVYGPPMRLRATVAAAPAAELEGLAAWLDGSPQFGYVHMTAYGFRAAYPELAAAGGTGLDTAGLEAIGDLCVRDILERHAGGRLRDCGLAALLAHPAFRARLRENSPGWRDPGVPVLLVQGEADDTVPAGAVRRLLRRYAGLGADLSAHFYPYVGHPDIMDAAAREIVEFVDGALARPLRPRGARAP